MRCRNAIRSNVSRKDAEPQGVEKVKKLKSWWPSDNHFSQFTFQLFTPLRSASLREIQTPNLKTILITSYIPKTHDHAYACQTPDASRYYIAVAVLLIHFMDTISRKNLSDEVYPVASAYWIPSSMEAVRNQKEDLPYDSKDPLYKFWICLGYWTSWFVLIKLILSDYFSFRSIIND